MLAWRYLADLGRDILQNALGQDGWQAAKEAKKAEMRRWRSLSEEQRKVEREADLYDYEGWHASVGESIRRRVDKMTTANEEHSEE